MEILNEIKLTPLLDSLKLEKIDDDVYFSKKYSNYISNSRLGLLNPKQGGSPEMFFEGFKNTGFSPSLQTGSAVHELILQPELFDLAPDIGKPSAKLGAMAEELYPCYFKNHYVTKEEIIAASDKIDYYKGKISDVRANEVNDSCKSYWSAKEQFLYDLNSIKRQIFLDAKSRETVLGCVNSVNANSSIIKLLRPECIVSKPAIGNEATILLDLKADCPNGMSFIMKLKAKLDNYTIDFDTNTITVNDLKTLGRVLGEFDNNIKAFSYNRELAFYLYLLRLVSEKHYNLINPKIRANYLVVSTILDYNSRVRPLFFNELHQGFLEFKTLLKYAAYLIGYKGYAFK